MHTGRTRVLPWRYILPVLCVLVSSLGLLWGCGARDPYANLKISADTKSVNLQMDIDDRGLAIDNGKNVGQIILSVTGAPDVISKRMNVTSLDEAVARVVGTETSGDRTRVTIAAVNGGRTQIRALTSGGGKDIFIDVAVDIPARALEVKPDVQFGIKKGGTLNFGTESFNLYASEGVRDFRWSTTLNNINFKLEGSPSGAEFNTQTGVLSLSAGSPIQSGNKIRLTATLASSGYVLDPIDVYVFDPFDPIKLNGINKTTEIDGQSVPVTELIRNGDTGQDTVATGITFESNASRWRHQSVSGGNYGYFVENQDPNLVFVRDAQNTSFSLFANSTGQNYVDVVLFPIASDGTKFDGDPVTASDGSRHYRRPQDAQLWQHHPLKVEIRHVFRDTVSVKEKVGDTEVTKNVNHLQILQDDEVLGNKDIIALYPRGTKITEAERRRFNVALADGIVVNNTDQVPNNNYVTFEWVSPALPSEKNIWDVFDITYCTRVSHDHTTDPVMTPALYSRGVPYTALFSLTLKDPSYIDVNIVIRVKSIGKKASGSPLGSVDMHVYGAQSIGSIQTFAQIAGIDGATRNVSLPKLYPIRGIGQSYEFYVVTDKNSNSSRWTIENYNSDRTVNTSLFSFSTEQVTPTVTRVRMALLQGASAYQLGKDYDIRVTYASGYNVTLKAEVLDRLNDFDIEDIQVREVSGEQVYNTVYNALDSKITAYVRINALYAFALPSSITRAGVWFEVSGITLSGDNQFRLTEEKTFNATLTLFALNSQVFPSGMTTVYNIDIVVVNPIVSASLSRSFVQLLSDNTLGIDDEAAKYGADALEGASFATITMNMTYAFGTAKNTPDISVRLDNEKSNTSVSNTFVSVDKLSNGQSFRVLGLRGNAREIVVRFYIEQIFGDVKIDFTFGEGIPLHILVTDALQVESIRPEREFLQVELNGQPRDVQLRATVYPNTPPRLPYNSRLAYGLEISGVWQAPNAQGIIETEHLRLNTLTGQMTAKASTRRLTYDYVVVIYSRDSLKTGAISVGINPRTFARISVFILDTALEEVVISTKQQFLSTFYTGQSMLNGVNTWRSRTDEMNGFYQIAADIDLTGEYLEPIHNFNGHLMGSYTYTLAGGRRIAQYSISGIQLFQPHVAADNMPLHASGDIARYGFISRIGSEGIVEGINFRSVSSYAAIDSYTGTAAVASIGAVAAINHGIIRDVAVYVSQQRSLSVTVSSSGTINRLFVGGLVGINYGLIEEDVVGIYATGDVTVAVSRLLEVNAGGLAGANFGRMDGETAARILEENILTNSDMVIAITQAASLAGAFNAGGLVGYNVGEINRFSSEAAVYNSARGNSGGLVGYNQRNVSLAIDATFRKSDNTVYTVLSSATSGNITGSYSNGALYAQGVIGGLVGQNDSGVLRECYYDFYVNTKVKDSLAGILATYAPSTWSVKNFYAGIIVTGDGKPNGVDSKYHTTVGGIVGVNNNGTMEYCFATSAFDKDTGAYSSTTGKFGEILGLRFMGDIFINEGKNISVGGLIGRNTGTTTVLRSYSNLSIYYESDSSGVAHSNTIAGLICNVQSGTMNFTYCYSNITINLRGNVGQVGVGGLLGTSSGSCVFTLCYSLIDSSSVSVNIAGNLNPLAIGATGVTYNSVRTSVDVPAATTNLSGWTYSTQNASTGFMNCATDAAVLECKGGSHSNCIGGGRPMIRGPQGKPLFIAKPVTISLKLRRHDGLNGYKSIYGASRNDRGGFNFVVPETDSSGDPYGIGNRPFDTWNPKAAMFFSSGNYYASSIKANRYYLDDIFTTVVSPLIAERRVAARIDKAGSDVAEIGHETVWNANKGIFEPRYFVDVKKVGYFELVVESTRDVKTPAAVAARVQIDIVDGISYQSVVSNFSGTVGYQSLLTADNSNGVNFSHYFSARRNQSFFFRAGADNTNWNFLILEGSGSPGKQPLYTTAIDPWSAALNNNALPNGRLFKYNDTGHAIFSFIPYIITPSGGVYHARALEIRIRIQIYAGATELTLNQSLNKIDGTSSAAFDGKIVTDVTFFNDTDPSAPKWIASTTLEQRLLTLVNFNFFDGKENHPLFGRTGMTALYSTVTRVPVRSNAAGSEQDFTLVFSLRDVKVQAIGDYDVYTFKVLLSIEVSPEALYKDKGYEHFETGVSAIMQGAKGTLTAREIQYAKNSHGEPLKAEGAVEVYAQDLQSVEFQHYARTEKVGGDGLSLGKENGLTGEGQQQSMNIFTENGVGGLFKVYVNPYFSNIDSFSMKSSVFVNQMKNSRGEVIVEEKWDISFRQMVWDVQQQKYVNASSNADAPFIQVSEKNGESYSWTGVYYIQTNLRYLDGVPTMRLDEGTRFNIAATFKTNGRTVSYQTALFALNMPGIYFDHDNETGVKDTNQAVGTLVPLRVHTVGAVKFSTQRKNGTPILDSENNLVSYEIIIPTQQSLSNLAKIEKDAANENLYWLKIDPSFPYEGSLVNTITVRFHGTLDENGLRLPIEADLNVTPVLFKVSGFKLAGIAGNNIRLVNQNRQSTILQAVVSHYTREEALTLFGSVNETLLSTIQSEVSRFNSLVNQSEDVFWEGVVDGVNWQLNSRSLGTGSEFYNRNTDKGLNFVLGKSNKTNNRFIMASVVEQRTNGLSIEAFFVYNNGLPAIWSSTDRTNAKSSRTNYNVITVRQSDEGNPIPIYKNYREGSAQLEYMVEGQHYILMEDIELTAWTPIPFVAASLDGNNKKLTVNNFALPAALPSAGQTNIGLFTEVAKGSVIKNVNLALPKALSVDITDYQFSAQQYGDQLERNTVNIGALAGTNNGIITNCAVLTNAQFSGPLMGERVDYSRSTFNRNASATSGQIKGNAQSRLEVFAKSENANIRLGGLIGNNGVSGVISNSRVMVDVYMNGAFNSENDTTDTTGREVNVRTAAVAGLAAVNSGHVVSSFFRDANVVNNAVVPTNGGENWTAGLVARNLQNAVIRGSYAMGVSTGTNAADGTVLAGEIRSNNNVGAVVCDNVGTVTDCYANIIISKARSSAGMVYSNTGTVRNSFAANPYGGVELYGFVSAGSGKLENNVYIRTDDRISLPTNTLLEADLRSLSALEMRDITKFEGFSIAASHETNFGNIWRMTGGSDGSRNDGPRLVSANDIAISIREVTSVTGSAEMIFYYVEGFNYGSSRNPVLLTDGKQFNKLIYESTDAASQDEAYRLGETNIINYEKNVYEGQLRLVNNISLAESPVQTHKVTFRNGVLDGNGLTISDITINATDEVNRGLKSVGLFSRVEYSTIKNLNLAFGASAIQATNAPYAGGLSGVAINSNLINVSTTSQNSSQIEGRNFVGGVVGAAVQFGGQEFEDNKYRIEHLSSNMSVRSSAGNFDGFPSFISAADYMRAVNRTTGEYDNSISVAGGIIGFVTNNPVNDRAYLIRDNNGVSYEGTVEESTTTVAYITNVTNSGNAATTIRGAISGGLVGVIDKGISVSRAVYQPVTVGSSSIRGRFYAGGIAGANFGTIEKSRVSGINDAVVPLNIRSVFDTSYISVVKDNYGAIVESRGLIVGGVAGFNNGTIRTATVAIVTSADSYQNMLGVGGVVGESRGGTITGCTLSGAISGGFIVGGIVGMNFDNGAELSNNVFTSSFDWTTILKEQGKGENPAAPLGNLFLSGDGKSFTDYLFRTDDTNRNTAARAGVTGGIIGYNTATVVISGTVLPNNVDAFGTLSRA